MRKSKSRDVGKVSINDVSAHSSKLSSYKNSRRDHPPLDGNSCKHFFDPYIFFILTFSIKI